MTTMKICIFAYLFLFKDCGFYFIMKRCVQFLNKMADRGHLENNMELWGMGRAQILLQAIENFRRREEGQVSSCPLYREVGQE